MAHRRRVTTTSVRGIAAGALALAAATGAMAGCSGSSAGPAPSSSTTGSTGTATAHSSIEDGAVLTKPVTWQVTATLPDESDGVVSVDYFIDGKKQWSEKSSPYFFNDDHDVLAPWLLGSGRHTLTAKVDTISEGTLSVSADVTVHPSAASDTSPLAGTYTRTATKADLHRVQSYRDTAHGAFGDVPLGDWRMRISDDGLMSLVDSHGATPEPMLMGTADTFTLYGVAFWLENGDIGSFCEPEQPSSYRFQQSATTLTISTVDHECADRDLVVAGTWTRQ